MKVCPICKKDFEPNRDCQIYCGASCGARKAADNYKAWKKLNPLSSRPKKAKNCCCPKCGIYYYRAGYHDGRMFCEPCKDDIEKYEVPDIIAAEYSVGRAW